MDIPIMKKNFNRKIQKIGFHEQVFRFHIYLKEYLPKKLKNRIN
jgi:hypothetical protein